MSFLPTRPGAHTPTPDHHGLRRPEPGPVPPADALRARLRRRHHLARLPTLILVLAVVGAGASGAVRALTPPPPVAQAPAAEPAPADRETDTAAGPFGIDAHAVLQQPTAPDGRPEGPAAGSDQPVDDGGTDSLAPNDERAGGRLGLARDERAAALAPGTALPPLAADDRVELVAVAIGTDGLVTARPLGLVARVLSVEAAAVTVAVPAGAVVELIRHQAQGPIEFVLLP